MVVNSYPQGDVDNERGEGMTWQPIETAPKPLKVVLIDLWVEKPDGEGYRVISAWWDTDAAWVVAGFQGARMKAEKRSTHKITHWMPAPDKPGSK